MSDNYLQATTLASMTAQIFTKLLVYPIDTIKTKQQITIGFDHEKHKISNLIQKTYKNEGLKGFYRGVFVAAFGSAPAFGLYMTTYQYSKKKLNDYEFFQKHSGFKIFVSGFMAEIIACIIWLPADVIKERLQVQSNLKLYNYKHGIEAIKKIVQTEGIKGIYRGYGATLCYFAPWSSFYFYFYEKFKALKKDNLRFFDSFLFASMAGLSAGFLMNFVDVVKVRLQVQRTVVNNGNENVQNNLNNQQQPKHTYKIGQYGYKNIFHGVYSLFKNEGIKSFLKGFGPHALVIIPSTALSMGFTENIRQAILKKWEDRE